MSDRPGAAKLVAELKRRRVIRVVLVYAAVAFAAWQVADIAFPALGIPDWGVTLVVVLSALGLPFAVVLSWAFDLTAAGVIRTPPPSTSSTDGERERPADGSRQQSDPERWGTVQELFWQALDAEPQAREGILRRLTDDREVRREVQSLLAAHADNEDDERLQKAFASLTPFSGRAPAVGSLLGQYRIDRRLGGGGMGVVYRAEDTRLGRTVALKFLAPAFSADPTAKRRFLAEARAAAALDHPNICTILEVGDAGDQLFISMPYYEGRTLEQLLERKPLEPGRAVSIAADIARGLAAAHAAGIVHRDIKPANVIVLDDGVAKVLDFGVAKMADQNLTRTGAALGTVSYMSPEQTRGEVVDHRTDIWSLGVVLYEMLSGDRPFRGPTEESIRTAILTSPPSRLTVSEGMGGLGRIVERALQKDPANRYPSALELLSDLEQLRLEPSGSTREDHEEDAGSLMRQGERRQITVLVVLLDGFDELVEQLPPESVESVLQRTRHAAGSAVTAEGGTVHSVQADRIECVFGIPKAREDDAIRAVRAALELRSRCEEFAADLEDLPQPVSIRAGVDVGTVAVQEDPEEPGRYRIGRSLMQRAARLASEAGSGDILLSPDCNRLVHPFFTVEPGPDVSLGHAEGTFRTHRALEAHPHDSSLDARASGGLTPFVGRTGEIAALSRILDAALDGSGKIVSVSGEAGLGKSRLLYEFEKGVLDGRVRVLRGRCQSYGAAGAYLPFLEILRALLFDGSSKAPGAEVLEVRVQDLGPELLDYVPLYQHLLNVAGSEPLPPHLSGDQLRLALVESIAAILTVASSEEPCVVLLEDWHWADEASIAALAQLGELISAFPLLVVVTHRPGYGVTWDGVGSHTSLQLEPLVAETTRSLVASTLRVDDVSTRLVEQIHARAQGNPFFTEEMCAALLEERLVTIRGDGADLAPSTGAPTLPDSVQAVIRTRLDRMAAPTREVLSAASVVGREFTRGLLRRALSERADLTSELEKLRAAALIQQIRLVPDATYRFKHALIQEVTYESLLAHERKRLHRRVGEAIEETVMENEDPPWARLADHFGSAEAWPKAMEYALKAAHRAKRLSQIPEAQQALELAEVALRSLGSGASYEHELDLLLMKERICETTGQRREQRNIIDRLVSLTRGRDEPAVEAEVLLRAGDLEVLLHNGASAEAALLQAMEKAQQAGDSATHRKALRSLGLLRWHQDRNDEAIEILEQVLESDRTEGDEEGIILDHHNLGSVYRSKGEVTKALELARESVRLAADSPFRKVYASHTVALCQRDLGKHEEAIETWTRTIELCERHHLPLQQAYLMTSLAHFYLILGRTEKSVAMYRDSVKLTRRVRHAEGGVRAATGFARVLEGLDRPEEALEYWDEALGWLTQIEEREREVEARSRVAAIREQLGDPQRAMGEWASVHELAEEIGDCELDFVSLEALGRLTRQHLGASALAIPYYERALAVARRMDDPLREGSILNSLGVVAWEAQEYHDAEEHYADAARAFRAAGDAFGLGLALNSLGQVLRHDGRHEEALETLEAAVEHNRESEQTQLEAYALAALGDTIVDTGRPDLAYEHFQRSLELRRLLGDRLGEGWMLQRLARTAQQLGQLDRVRELLSGATVIAEQENDPTLNDACAKLRR